MREVTTLLIVLAGAFTAAGLIPCLGWLNWFGIPCSVVCASLGIAGMVSDKDAGGANQNTGLYTAAIVVGVLCVGIGAVRCLLGGGVV